MAETDKTRSDARSVKRAARDLKKAEAGDTCSAEHLHQAEQAAAAAAGAVEQQAAFGAGNRGLSR